MNFTLRGSLLILKHLHPTKLRRPGLRACSLGPRGQRWGPGTFGQTSQATDPGPRQETPWWELPAQHHCLLLRPLLFLFILNPLNHVNVEGTHETFCGVFAGDSMPRNSRNSQEVD